MISRIFGCLNKIIYRVKFGKSVSFSGVPRFVSHMQIYIQSGEVKTGKNFTMKQGVYMAAINGGKILLGNNVSINRNCLLVCHDTISIADNCAIGPNVVFYDHDHMIINSVPTGLKRDLKHLPLLSKRTAGIGAGATILRGTHIGEGSVIGAGAVVRGDIPPHSLVTSNRELNITPIISKGI